MKSVASVQAPATGATRSAFETASKTTAGSRNLLVLLILLALTRAVAYAVLNPPFGSPDEHAHFEYVQYLARGAAGEPGAEAHQPAPYYALMVPFLWLTSGQTPEVQLLAIRLASIPFMLGTVALTWLTARKLTPDGLFVPVVATAFVALHPQFAYIGSSANNDNAANLASAVLIYLIVSLLSGSAGRLTVFATVLAAGASIVTKGQALPVTVVSAIVLLGYLLRWAAATRSREPILYLGIAVLVALGLALTREGTALVSRVQTMTPVFERWQESMETAGRKGLEPFYYQFFTFWAAFLGEVVRPPVLAYLAPAGAIALAAIGYAACAIRRFRTALPFPSRLVLPHLALLTIVVGVWLLSYLSYLRVNNPSFQGAFWSLPTISGRYLFTAIVPVAVLSAEGWGLLISRRYWIPCAAVLILLWAMFDILSMVALFDSYRWPLTL